MKTPAMRLGRLSITLAAAVLLSSGCSAASTAGGTNEGPATATESPEVRVVKVIDPVVSPTGEGAAACGTEHFVADATMQNLECARCVSTSCALPECLCVSDPARAADGLPACSVYVACLYTTFRDDLAAAPRDPLQDLARAEATCQAAGPYTESSVATGNLLLGCMTVVCSDTCGGPM